MTWYTWVVFPAASFITGLGLAHTFSPRVTQYLSYHAGIVVTLFALGFVELCPKEIVYMLQMDCNSQTR